MSTLPQQYVEHGFALVPIPRGQKGPTLAGWNKREQCVTSVAAAAALTENVGLAHRWSTPITVAVDVDDWARAVPKARAIGVDLAALLEAAVQIVSGRENRAKFLFRLPPGVEPFASRQFWKTHGRPALELRCADASGLTVQDVLPPSIHPHTGQPYAWRGDWTHPTELLDKFLELALGTEERAPRGAPRRQRPLTLGAARELLKHIDADDRERWLKVGIVLGRAFGRRDEAWALYEAWARGSELFAVDSTGNIARMREMFFEESQQERTQEVGVGSLFEWAGERGFDPAALDAERYEVFWGIRPANKHLYLPSGELWIAEAVNAVLPPRTVGADDHGRPITVPAARWLMQERGIDSVVYDPTLPQIVEDRVARAQGIIEHAGARLFNIYQPPTLALGSAEEGERWFGGHLRRLLPVAAEAEHFVKWLAHRVQKPGEKVRHALLIIGPPGVGKDTIFEAALPALGVWNTRSIGPDAIFESFNEYARSVLVRINEVADLHDISKWKFYEATKDLIAGAEYITVNPKYGVKYSVRNCVGVVMTTNYGAEGIYLKPDDRRHFVVETCALWGTVEERSAYFKALWAWLLAGGGFGHVAAYLHAVDLRDWDPNAPPPKTPVFKRIAGEGLRSDAWLADALDALGNPTMLRLDALRTAITADMRPQEVSRMIGAALTRAGYELLMNAEREDGRHNLRGADGERINAVIYIKRGTPSEELRTLFEALEVPRF